MRRTGRGRAGLCLGRLRLPVVPPGEAAVADRAAPAGRGGAGAEPGAEVHDGLGVLGHACRGGVALGEHPEPAFHRRAARPVADGVVATQDALDIAVEDRMALPERERQDCPGSRATDPRQGHESRQVFGQGTGVALAGDPGRGLEVPGTGVITEPRPQVQDLVERRLGQGPDPREARDEALEIRDDGRDPGLLQHDLGDPHPVRRRIPLPQEVAAAVVPVPNEEPPADVARRFAIRIATAL